MPKLPCNFSRFIGICSCYSVYSDLGSSCLDCMHGFPASIGNVRVNIYPSLFFWMLVNRGWRLISDVASGKWLMFRSFIQQHPSNLIHLILFPILNQGRHAAILSKKNEQEKHYQQQCFHSSDLQMYQHDCDFQNFELNHQWELQQVQS